MVMTPAQRRAKNKYDAAHYTNIAIKVSKEEADEIRARCQQYGVTPSAVLKEGLTAWMETHPKI